MRPALLLLLLAACRDPAPAPEPEPAAEGPRTARADPVVAEAARLLAAGRIDRARAYLEGQRWYSGDRARASLLLCGCLLAEKKHAAAMDALRGYLEKTTRRKNPRDSLVIFLLRHHAAGGGLKARTAEEATYVGLYALGALDEPETARPDLERAAKEAPEPERLLARLVLE